MPTHAELVNLELARNAEGRPNLYEHVQFQAVDRIMEDVHGMTKKLDANFGKWDANSDGVLTPIELEDFTTNHSNSVEDRTAAAAVRRAYDILANMDAPNLHSTHDFLERTDVDGLNRFFDPSKLAKAADELRQKDYTAKMKSVEDSNFFVRAATAVMFKFSDNPHQALYENAAKSQNYFLSNLPRSVRAKESLFEFGRATYCTSNKQYSCFKY